MNTSRMKTIVAIAFGECIRVSSFLCWEVGSPMAVSHEKVTLNMLIQVCPLVQQH